MMKRIACCLALACLLLVGMRASLAEAPVDYAGELKLDMTSEATYRYSRGVDTSLDDWASRRRRDYGAAAAWSERAAEVARILETIGLY